jgi:hypothetical protein
VLHPKSITPTSVHITTHNNKKIRKKIKSEKKRDPRLRSLGSLSLRIRIRIILPPMEAEE